MWHNDPSLTVFNELGLTRSGLASVKEAVIPGAWSQPLVMEEKLDIIAGTGGTLAGLWPGDE